MSKLIKKFQLPDGGIDRRSPSSTYQEYMSGRPQMTYWMGEMAREPEYVQMGRDNAKIRDEVYGKPQSRTNYVTATPKEQQQAARDGYTAKQKALAALGLYKSKVDGVWGRGSQAAEKEALTQGYKWNGNDYVKDTPQQTVQRYKTLDEDVQGRGYQLFTDLPRSLMANMFPYSYGEDEDGKATSTATGDLDHQSQALARKMQSAINGKDPRRQLMEDLADNEIGSEVWNNYLKGEALENFRHPYWRSHPEELQFALRGRLDQMSLAENRGQKYNTYEVNPNYSSKSAGDLPTYRIADPKRRAAEYANALAYMRANKDKAVRSKDGKSYIWSVIGDPYAQHGNYSLVADDLENLTNARFVDNWDYVVNPAGNSPVWVGDYLQEGIGAQPVNARRMREAITETDITPTDMAGSIAKLYMQNMYDKAKGKVKSLLPFGKTGVKLVPKYSY